MCRFWLSILLIGGFLGCGESDQNSSDTERNSKTPKEAKIPLQSDKTKIEKTSPFKPQGIHNVKFAGIEMIWVPAGSFQMGSPFNSPVRIMDEKPHNVELTRGFYLGKYEITQRQYALVMEDNVQDLKPLPSRFQGPSLPVEQVSWKDVQEFCARLTYLERRDQRLNKGWAYCLPTEAEWEYACRGGTATLYSWGNEIFLKNAAYRESAGKTRLIGQFPSNPWGFFDMHGNVWEWVDDWYGDYSTDDQTDPEGALSGTNKVLRGGSWANLGTNLRAAGRHYLPPSTRSPTTGFRLCYKRVQ